MALTDLKGVQPERCTTVSTWFHLLFQSTLKLLSLDLDISCTVTPVRDSSIMNNIFHGDGRGGQRRLSQSASHLPASSIWIQLWRILNSAAAVTAVPLQSEAYLHVQSIHGVSSCHISAGAAIIFQVMWANPRRTVQLRHKAQHGGEVIEDRVYPGEAQPKTICRKRRRKVNEQTRRGREKIAPAEIL